MEFERIWAQWDGVHDEKDQKSRLASAKKANMTPVSVNPDNGSGEFAGSVNYRSTLDSCTCIDFTRRQKPCKHMYRLAIELGVIDEVAKSDRSKIRVPRAERVQLGAVVDEIESMPQPLIDLLRELMKDLFFNKKDLLSRERTAELDELIKRGFFVESEKSNNENVVISINTRMEGCQRKVYSYLLRRDAYESYLDPETGEMIDVPYGASLIYNVKLDGSRGKAEWKMPDDEITLLLDKHGKNRCNNY